MYKLYLQSRFFQEDPNFSHEISWLSERHFKMQHVLSQITDFPHKAQSFSRVPFINTWQPFHPDTRVKNWGGKISPVCPCLHIQSPIVLSASQICSLATTPNSRHSAPQVTTTSCSDNHDSLPSTLTISHHGPNLISYPHYSQMHLFKTRTRPCYPFCLKLFNGCSLFLGCTNTA